MMQRLQLITYNIPLVRVHKKSCSALCYFNSMSDSQLDMHVKRILSSNIAYPVTHINLSLKYKTRQTRRIIKISFCC